MQDDGTLYFDDDDDDDDYRDRDRDVMLSCRQTLVWEWLHKNLSPSTRM